MTKMRFGTLAVLALWMMMQAAAVTDAEWGTTIDVAGRQRMLSQRMSKEFFYIAMGFEVDANKAALAGSIKLFDDSLDSLINGNSASNIAAAPSDRVAEGLQVVLGIWTPFKDLLEKNMDTVRGSNGQVDISVLKQVAEGNVPLLKKSNAVVGRLVDAAKSSGANTAGLVVDIAGRQRMLIQRMCKEVLLISLGISVEVNMGNLQSTSSLFGSSHAGIILGATWAGVPRLTSMCTLQQMRAVTYEWENFEPFIETILAAETPSQGKDIALGLTKNISDGSKPLFSAMVGAVKLYVNDDGLCTPIKDVDSAGWTFLLNNAGKQRFLGQQISQLFMQIANGIAVAESKVSLTVQMGVTSRHLRSLIEGSIANNIPAPPTQEIANQLLQAYDTWVNLEALLQTAVSSDVTPGMVAVLYRLSAQILSEINSVVLMYEDACEANDPSVSAYLINIAGRQRMLYQKMSKEASMIAYGEHASDNWDLLNSTRAMFIDVHWQLLLGAPATNSTPALPKMTHRCFIQQMKTVADKYDSLQSAALNVAQGDVQQIQQLITLNPEAFAAMNTAVGWITKLPAEPTCDALVVSSEEWTGAITAIGELRSLTQQVTSHYILAENGNIADKTVLKETVDKLAATIKNLNFGHGAARVPAPFNQEVLDFMFALSEKWSSYQEQLGFGIASADGERRLQTDATVISNKGLEMLTEAEKAMDTYASAASQEYSGLPVQRMIMASGQVMLAQKIAKEALMLRFAGGISGSGLDSTIEEFEKVQDQLTNGGATLEAIIPEREDLIKQMEIVEEAWTSFKADIQAFAESSNGNGATVMVSLSALDKELQTASELFGIEDPYVEPTPPPPEPFPWTLMIYIALASVLIVLCCVAVIAAGVCKSKDAKDVHKQDWQKDFGGANTA